MPMTEEEEFEYLTLKKRRAESTKLKGAKAEEDNNDRLMLSDPALLPALERQQAMAVSQGLPPQYSKGQMDEGASLERQALLGYAGMGLLSPTATLGKAPVVNGWQAIANPSSSLFGEAIEGLQGPSLARQGLAKVTPGLMAAARKVGPIVGKAALSGAAGALGWKGLGGLLK